MPRKKLSRADFDRVIAEERRKLEQARESGGMVLVNVSGGSASAVSWSRCLDWFGDERVHAVFADTMSEDEDTYRFLDDCEKEFGILDRLQQGMDIWDCFDKHGMMRIAEAGNACKASVELKQKPLDTYADKLAPEYVAVGYSVTEAERMLKLNARKNKRMIYPLVGRPVLAECDINGELKRMGIEPPRVYEDGYVHNNCLGAGGCILAGLGQWNATRRLNPEAFEYAKQREKAFYERTGFTILRDQRGGKVESYTLEQLEEDAKAGRQFPDDWKSNCSCMSPMLFELEELFDGNP